MYKRKQGFALVSTLVTVAIVIILVTALTQISVTTSRTSQSITNKTQASFLARSAMERLFLEDYNELNSYEKELSPDYTGFKEVVIIDNVDNPEGKKITVKVEYSGGHIEYSATRYASPGGV